MSKKTTSIPYQNLPLLLLHTRERVMDMFRPVLNQHDVTEQQWRVMRALYEVGELEPRQLVAICRISSPSLTGVLARMDELNLINRTRMEDDQRRVTIQLTTKAKRILESASPEITEIYHALEKKLGQKTFTDLHKILQTVIDKLPE